MHSHAMPGPVLVPVLGDQLSTGLASLRGCGPADTVVLMMEVWEEATYVRHHQQKTALIFSAMRHPDERLLRGLPLLAQGQAGEGACPFNPLYGHFMARNREVPEKNPRIGRADATWDRMGEDRQREYLDSAEAVLAALEPARAGWARVQPSG